MSHDPSLFTRFAKATSHYAGTPVVFGVAVLAIVVWAITGPIFQYSDTWQLVINTGTTIITFLMVFLIQNTQNRDSQAVQVKLDELIKSHGKADDKLLDLEELEEEDMKKLRDEYQRLAKKKRGED
ncbi:MAG: low affinity iron permease family protein [Flavobacteriales bacterium]|nr:low affinity iron permease family protein [Flavobacteriales bacterium]